MAYIRNLSPTERWARVQERRQQLESIKVLKEYQKYIEEQEKLEKQRKEEEERQANNGNFVESALHTVVDLGANFLTGVSKGVEGIVDLGIGVVGGVGGLFSSDFQQGAQDAIAYDWTGETFANDWQNALDKSWLNQNAFGGMVENVAQGIGQMLPSVAVTAATGGLSAGTVAAQAAGMATMAASAAGSGAEEAYNDGAGFYQGMGYGLTKGAIEAATERLGGFMFDGGSTVVGSALAKTNFGKYINKGLGKVAYNFVSEGAEEVLSDLADPAAKSIYKGLDSFKEYANPELYKQLPETFFVGGSVGSVMSGGQTLVKNAKNKSRGGAQATQADEMLAHISEVSKNYGTDSAKNAKYDKTVNDTIDSVSKNLKAMNEDQRKTYLSGLERSPFAYMFDGDGNVIAKKADYKFNPEAITGSLNAVSGNLTHKIVEGEISEDALTVKDTIERVFKDRAHVAISDDMKSEDRALYDPDSGIIYVNNNAEFDASFTSKMTAIHEMMHAAEGTEQYNELCYWVGKFVNMSPEIAPELASRLNVHINDSYERYDNDYEGFDEEQNRQANDYVKGTEFRADVVAELLGNEEYIAKLAARNEGLVKKLYTYITTAQNKTESKEAKRFLNKISKAFGTALDNSRGGVKISTMFDEKDDEQKENTPEGVNERKSIVVLANGNTYVKADRKVITGQTADDMRRDITNFFDSLLEKKKSLDIPTIEGEVLTITKAETADKARDNYKEINKKRIQMTDAEFAVKARVESHIDELAEIAGRERGNRVPDTKNHPFAKDGFSYRTVYFEDFDESYYKIRLSVGHNGSVATVYNVGKITKDISPSAKIIAVVGSNAPVGNVFNNTISQNKGVVNSNFMQKSENDTSKGEKVSENASKQKGNIDERHSIKKINGKDIVVIDTDQDIFEGADKSEYRNIVKSYMKERFRGKTIENVKFKERSEREYTSSKYTNKIYNKDSTIYESKMRASTELDNLVKTGEFLGWEEANHPKDFNKKGYNRYSVQFVLDNKAFSGEMLIALGENDSMFYDIVKIKESSPTFSVANHTTSATAYNNTVPQREQNVNNILSKNSENDTSKGKKVSGGVDERKSMAGKNAKNVDKFKLSRAEYLEEQGFDSEEIRQETGWFRGLDGKWRFEINDKDMKLKLNFKELSPEVKEIKILQNKYAINTITKEEADRYEELLKLHPYDVPNTLHRFVDHKLFFESYPDLQHISVLLSDDPEVGGTYLPTIDAIQIYIDTPSYRLKNIFAHEMQHAVQVYEGFDMGGSPEYWEKRISQGYSRDLQDFDAEYMEENIRKLYDLAPDGLKEKINEVLDAARNGDNESIQKIKESILGTEWEEAYLAFLDASGNLSYFNGRGNPSLSDRLYMNTAGEIEARDAATRRYYTDEQRKNIRPDIDVSDVVFNDGSERTSWRYKHNVPDDFYVRDLHIGIERKNFDSFDEYEYSNFAWAIVNGIMTLDQYKDLAQKFAAVKDNKHKDYVRNLKGNYIVAIGSSNDGFGVDDMLAYVTGTADYFRVEKIVKVNLDNQTDIQKVKDFIFEKERSKHARACAEAQKIYGEEAISIFTKEDLPDYETALEKNLLNPKKENELFDPENNKTARMLFESEQDRDRVPVNASTKRGEDERYSKKKAKIEKNNIGGYTIEEEISIKRDVKNKIATSYDDVLSFVSDSCDGTGTGRLFVGKINSATADKIKKTTNISVFGKSLVLTSDEIRHIFRHHGDEQSEALRGQEAVTKENFLDIIWAIFESDSVEAEQDVSGTIYLVFQKETEGKVTAVTVVSEKKKSLTLKTARITKKGQHISPPFDVQAPNPTPDSELSLNTIPTDSISQKSDLSTQNQKENVDERASKRFDSSNKDIRYSKTRSSGNQVDNSGKTRYNKKRIAQYIPKSKVGLSAWNHIDRKLRKVYANMRDGIADNVAIEYENSIFVVDSGKDRGELTFGVRKRITVGDEIKRRRYIQEINKEAAENGGGGGGGGGRRGIELERSRGSDV